MPTLYGINGSPFVRKVRVVLAEKGVAYDHDPVMPGNPDPAYRNISPLGRITAWRDGDHAFLIRRSSASTSSACTRSRRSTRGPVRLARSLWFEEYADTALIEIIGPRIFFPRVVGKRLMGKEPDEKRSRRRSTRTYPRGSTTWKGSCAAARTWSATA